MHDYPFVITTAAQGNLLPAICPEYFSHTRPAPKKKKKNYEFGIIYTSSFLIALDVFTNNMNSLRIIVLSKVITFQKAKLF